jgi:nitrogen fixation NifU-like protein
MSDLRELYQQVILDHNKSPRNYRRPEGANRTSEGFNPLCGDHLHVFLKVREGVIQDIGFEGSGCAISKASASLMTTALKGLKTDEVEALFRRFHDMVTGDVEQAPDTEGLGKLAVFAGVREFPARVKCASLAWHTMHAALEGKDQPISTE